jgi:hypothetical protein
LFDLPQYDEDVQLIRSDILIPKENRDILHHILVHLCERSYLQPAGFSGSECGTVPVRQEDMGRCLFSSIIVAWVFLMLIKLDQ